VDVGGKGQAIEAITKEKHGIDRKRSVLQDHAEVVDELKRLNSPELEGVPAKIHDFYEEQPIRGAACYYIRRCLHDYSDDHCAKILRS